MNKIARIKKQSFLSPHSLMRSFSSLQNHIENLRTYVMNRRVFLIITRRKKPSFFRRYAFSILAVATISLLRLFLNFFLDQNIFFIVFTFAVVLASWYGGLGPGLVATVLSVISGLFFAVEPNEVLSLMNPTDQVRIIIFLFQGGIISLLSETVQEANRWQSIVLESISGVFITYDRNMRFTYLNKKAEELFRVRRQDVLGKRLLDMYPEVRKSSYFKRCREAMRKQKPMEFELFLSMPARWFNICLYPSPDGISVYFQDVTRRKRIEKRLRESQMQLKRFVDANIIGVVIEGIDGQIYEANDAFLQMVGYTREDLKKGKVNWKTMTSPEYHEVDEKVNAALLKKGTAAPFVKEYIRKDGEHIFVMIGAVLLDRKTKKAMTFYLDITEQKELDRKKNEFISIASHELKTPLTSIKAFSQIMLKQLDKDKDKRLQYFLTNIDSQADRLNQLVSDLLDVSKMEEGRLSFHEEEFPLDALLRKVIVDFHYIFQSHTLIKVGESKKIIHGDRHRLEQVLINLISNAIKYSPQADRVIVAVRDHRHEVVVSVQDFGEGISPLDKERIFDRFFRARKHEGSKTGGFGLGLYITREIIARHNGKIWVESKEGKGSTFFFSLPTAKK